MATGEGTRSLDSITVAMTGWWSYENMRGLVDYIQRMGAPRLTDREVIVTETTERKSRGIIPKNDSHRYIGGVPPLRPMGSSRTSVSKKLRIFFVNTNITEVTNRKYENGINANQRNPSQRTWFSTCTIRQTR